MKGSWNVCEEVISVSSVNVTDIDSFPADCMLWNHELKQRKWLFNPELAMEWCNVEVIT